MIEVTMPNGQTFEISDDTRVSIERNGRTEKVVYPVKIEPGDRIVVRSTATVEDKVAEVKAALKSLAEGCDDDWWCRDEIKKLASLL